MAQGHREVPKAMWEVAEVLGPSQVSLVRREGPLSWGPGSGINVRTWHGAWHGTAPWYSYTLHSFTHSFVCLAESCALPLCPGVG